MTMHIRSNISAHFKGSENLDKESETKSTHPLRASFNPKYHFIALRLFGYYKKLFMVKFIYYYILLYNILFK